MRSAAGWIPFACAVWYGLFNLPFRFPPTQISISQSWVAGFDNRISVAAAIIASLFVFAACSFLYRTPVRTGFLEFSQKRGGIAPQWIWLVATIYVTVLGTLAGATLLSPRYFHSDIRYLLDPVRKISQFGLKPYVEFDFAYGPIILYPPLVVKFLLGWTGLSLEASYYIATVAVMAAGVWLVAWVIEQLIADGALRLLLFLGITLTGINITLGSNGTALRSLSSFALLLSFRPIGGFLSRFGAPRNAVGMTLYLYLCSFAAFLISPEIGIVFSCSAFCWAFLSGFFSSRWLFWCMVSPIAGVISSTVIYGSSIFDTVKMYSGGSMNWVMLPYSMMLLYLISLLILIPAGMSTILRSPGQTDRALLLSLYCCGLCLMPAALSRCDYGHLIIDGTGVFILAVAHLESYSRSVRFTSTAVLVTVLLAFECMSFFSAKKMLAQTFYDAGKAALPAVIVDTVETHFGGSAALRRFEDASKNATLHPVSTLPIEVGNEKVALPWPVDKITEATFRKSGALAPEYYTDFILVATPAQEKRKLDDIEKANWVLMPSQLYFGNWDRNFVRLYFLYPAAYRELHESYQAGSMTHTYILNHFSLVRQIGDYQLVRRK